MIDSALTYKGRLKQNPYSKVPLGLTLRAGQTLGLGQGYEDDFSNSGVHRRRIKITCRDVLELTNEIT